LTVSKTAIGERSCSYAPAAMANPRWKFWFTSPRKNTPSPYPTQNTSGSLSMGQDIGTSLNLTARCSNKSKQKIFEISLGQRAVSCRFDARKEKSDGSHFDKGFGRTSRAMGSLCTCKCRGFRKFDSPYQGFLIDRHYPRRY